QEAGLKDIAVTGNRTTGTLLVKGKPQLVPAEFVREGGAWKVDLTHLLMISDQLLLANAMASKRSDDAVINDLLNRLTTKAT
ncbi:hypothetical protein ACKI16_47815, partial [Streptomyces scabiei]|uniref:hypothetical protein n=1 Tax=Streptomyces scabiei TaxID=1930 RepID=UPI0038F73773